MMSNAVDIKFVIDEKYDDPNVIIRAKKKTALVDNIIQAVENVSEKSYARIPSHEGEEVRLVAQRDIVRAYSHDHKVVIQTETDSYIVKNTLIALEEILDQERFIRISQSEIINLYKVKGFDINIKGSIGIQFDNGIKSWVSRRYLKKIRDVLK